MYSRRRNRHRRCKLAPIAMTLSVAMITYQAERTLDHTLECIAPVADEIIIVDSYSTDTTAQIAKKYNANFTQSTFDNYGSQKQKAMDLCTGSWVLLLDDDEYASPELVSQLQNLKMQDSPYDALTVPRSLIFMGQKFKYGKEAKSPKLILYRNGKAMMQSAAVHEVLLVDGPMGKLSGVLWHDYRETYEESITKMDKYARLWAQSRDKKVTKWDLWLRKYFSFIKNYLLDGNFLNGEAGRLWAKSLSYYQYKKYLYLYDLNKS